jgi:class 3 adenylate cyclase
MILTKEKQKAIMFADISGSSALYKTKGNSLAKTVIDYLLTQIQVQTAQRKGRVIKTIGDEVMVSFSSAENCVAAAIAIQEEFAKSFLQHRLLVSIGISFGEVLLEKGDLFGEAVNDAAHLTKLAQGSQIIFSEAMYMSLAENHRSKAREFDRIKLKGATSASTIYRLYWQDEQGFHNETRFLSTDVELDNINKQILALEFAGQEIVIEANMTPFMIGRDSMSCQLTIEDSQISREHCHISYNRGKFVLVDHSTNGCYLKPANGLEFYLRREEFPLLESSELSLGVPTHKSTKHLIQINIQS